MRVGEGVFIPWLGWLGEDKSWPGVSSGQEHLNLAHSVQVHKSHGKLEA